MEVTNARVVIQQGYPLLLAEVDGQEAVIDLEQKAWEKFGLVYLGAEFEDAHPPVVIGPDAEDGRPGPMELWGFTDEPEVVELYRRFRAAADAGRVREGAAP